MDLYRVTMTGDGIGTFEIPFQLRGNRQVLTDEQIMDEPYLEDFIQSFPKCFEREEILELFVFYPAGDAPTFNSRLN